MVLFEPDAVIPLRHELTPPQVRLQVEPPNWIPPVHELLAQVMVQVVASRQSIAPVQPDAGQAIVHGIPLGHLIGPAHGLQPLVPQLNAQLPFTHEPPAARQLGQVIESLLPDVHAVPGPAAAPPPPPCPPVAPPPMPPDAIPPTPPRPVPGEPASPVASA